MVLDLHMPGLDGAEVLRRARSGMATAGLPVIVVTSDERPASEVALMEAGADDYLRKPVDPRLFVTRIRAALRRAGDHPFAADGPVLHNDRPGPGRAATGEGADRHREDPPPLQLLRA
jgi:DNA-binding response OmpR family regulator